MAIQTGSTSNIYSYCYCYCYWVTVPTAVKAGSVIAAMAVDMHIFCLTFMVLQAPLASVARVVSRSLQTPSALTARERKSESKSHLLVETQIEVNDGDRDRTNYPACTQDDYPIFANCADEEDFRNHLVR
jgi:hypothetical protein